MITVGFFNGTAKLKAWISTPRESLVADLHRILTVLLLMIGLILSGCQTSKYQIENVRVPYVVVKQTIMTTMPQGVRYQSANGREMHSGYFHPENIDLDATNQPERYQAKVIILGSSRPFRIDVRAYKEVRQKNSKQHESLGEDREVSKLLAKYFKDALANRREHRNVIDDFRAF